MPLSVIIIGVGNEKFKLMKELDSDDVQVDLDGGTHTSPSPLL